MASNPECCLTPAEWRHRFAQWIDHGTPENLLRANIYFDFRALAGEAALADTLREIITRQAMANPRFHKQLADDILRRGAPLNWLGAVETEAVGTQQAVDLKLRGTALFVDVARLRCLALGIAETNTRRRLEAVAEKMGADPRRREAWVQAFEFLQMLRLRVQIDGEASPGHVPGHANKIELAALNEIDRRLLKESLRVAQRLQKQVELDYAA
jgi:CBS domain-containing protein